MKLTIPRAALHVVLTQARRVVERRNTMPVLSNIRLSALGAGTLRVTATDLDIEIVVRTDASIETTGETTVPAHLLAELVAKMGDGPVSIEAMADNASVEIKAGRTRMRLQCLPVIDFPDLPASDLTHRFAIAAADIVEAIETTSFAISTEETRYYLNGIFMHFAEQLVIVATDGHRLARWRAPLPDGASGAPGVIVPRKTVGEILKIAKEAAKDGEALIKIALSETKIRFEIGDTVLTSKLVDGTFPDYGRVIPSSFDAEVAIDSAELTGAVGRVTTISTERGRAVKLTFAEETLRLAVENADAGSASEEIPVKTVGVDPANLTIGFNARYLGEVVGALAADTVTLRLPADAGSPTVFVPLPEARDGRDRLAVLMPMRV